MQPDEFLADLAGVNINDLNGTLRGNLGKCIVMGSHFQLIHMCIVYIVYIYKYHIIYFLLTFFTGKGKAVIVLFLFSQGCRHRHRHHQVVLLLLLPLSLLLLLRIYV